MEYDDMQRILDAIGRLEINQGSMATAIGRLEDKQDQMRADFLAELGKTRADIMERIDRQQTRLESIDGLLTMGLGYTDRVDRKHASLTEDNRLLGELLMQLTRLVHSIEGRVNGLEERKA